MSNIGYIRDSNNQICYPVTRGFTLYYNNGTGTKNDIELTDSIDNYSVIDVYFYSNDGHYGIKRVPVATESIEFDIISVTISEAGIHWWKKSTYILSGTTILLNGTRQTETKMDTSIISNTVTNNIYIYKVVGFK